MVIRKIGILIIAALMSSCQYDLDVSGVFYTPVPVNERFERSSEWISQNGQRHITLNRNSYTILLGSDSHVGGTKNISCFIDSAIEKRVDAIIISGDVTTGRAEDYEVAVAELSSLGEIDMCLVPGNHDLYFGGWESYFELFGPSVYTLSIDRTESSDLFIFLDSGGGTLGTLQIEWLQKLLKSERTSYENIIVVSHVNFFRPRFTTSTNLLNEELILLIDLFEKYKINLVIQGHDHIRYEELIGHTKYLTLDALKDGTRNASYLELNVSGNKIEYQFIDI